MNGRPSRSDIRANSYKLTKLEEMVIVNYILNQDSRGFSPQQANVEDMANNLLKTYEVKPIGKL
jgi:hypothetical protein